MGSNVDGGSTGELVGNKGSVFLLSKDKGDRVVGPWEEVFMGGPPSVPGAQDTVVVAVVAIGRAERSAEYQHLTENGTGWDGGLSWNGESVETQRVSL